MESYQQQERQERDAVAIGHDQRLERWVGWEFVSYECGLFLSELPAQLDCVLDLGCGPGKVAGALLSRAKRVVGLDFSIAMLSQLGRKHHEIQRVCADAVELPIKDRSFDAVVNSGLLIHLHRPELLRLMGEVRRVLRPGGLFVSDVLNAKYWNGTATRRAVPKSIFLERFSQDYARELAEAAGLKILRCSYYKAVPGKVIRTFPGWLAAERVLKNLPVVNARLCDHMLVTLQA